MLKVPTWLLSFFGLIFGLFHAVLGIVWINKNDRPEIVIVALVAYVAILIPTIAVGRSRAMPKLIAVVDVVICALIPLAINTQLDPAHLTEWRELYLRWFQFGAFSVYVVEVCQRCHWNFLLTTYVLGDGVPRRALPTPRDLLE